MPETKKNWSLRRLILFLVGGSFVVFTALVSIILYTTMPGMLLHAENFYFEQQRAGIVGLINAARRNTFAIANDIAVSEEIAAYAWGENPGYIKRTWPNSSPLESLRFNFLIIKNRNGENLYTEIRDPEGAISTQATTSFFAGFDAISQNILTATYSPTVQDLPFEKRGEGGIVVTDHVPYMFAAMPLMTSSLTEKPEGVVILGNFLTDDYLRDLTQSDSVTFAITGSKDASIEKNLHRASEEEMSLSAQFTDMAGNPVFLTMSAPRLIYTQGKLILSETAFMLVAAMLFFAISLYFIVMRFSVRPVEEISADIATAADESILSAQKYTGSLEFSSLCHSINERLQRLHQSKISLEVLQRILSGTDLFLYVSDFETDEILFLNANMRDHFGFDDSVLGKTCWKVFQTGMTERCSFCPNHKLARDSESVVIWEEQNVLTGKYYRNTGCLIEWIDGRRAHLQHRVEISDIKNAEEALKKRLEQEELMSALSRSFIANEDWRNSISNALSLAGRFMDVSRAVVARYDKNENCLTTIAEWINPARDILPAQQSSMPFYVGTSLYDDLVVKKLPYVAETQATDTPEVPRFGDNAVTSFIDVPISVDGTLWGVLSIDETIASRSWSGSDIQLMTLIGSVLSGVMTRGIIQEKLVRMSSIVESSPDHIGYITPAGNFEYINEGSKRLLDYSVDELLQGGPALILSDVSRQRLREEFLPMVLREGRVDVELPVTRKDGENRLFAYSAFTTSLASGGIGFIASDVTEQRALEREVIAAKEQAESSSRAKGEFLSRMSHEIRTPLNAIIGMTSIAKSSPELERKEYCLEKIESASTHLLGIINDILDMSKIEANKFELSCTEFNFEKMLIRTTNVINFRVEEKGQNLVVDLDSMLPPSIISDEQRLAQVLANLLSNAVKFTPDGGTIILSARLLEEVNRVCTIRISVTDTGIGISEESQRRLFTSFEQADGGIARKFGGTGLGLAISKSIVEMMDGTIGVTSREGEGATFTFTIRATRGTEHAGPRLSPDINWETLRILAVDDAPEVREFFHNFTDAIGLHCDVAANATEALAMLDTNGPGYYNIIFVDWKMPDMDGIELTRRIRADYGRHLVVILISATEWELVEDQARQAGVDKFIPKPLFSSIIVDCINQSLDARESISQSLAASPVETNGFAGKRILLVEDIAINREIVISLLEHTGVAIDAAADGREAFIKVRDNLGRYDAIFMDIHMPEVDGYEATRLIRGIKDERAARIPIIAMTANVFREDIEKCLAAGMNDHVGKPIDLPEMLEKLTHYLHSPHV